MPKTIDITKTSLRRGKLFYKLQESMGEALFTSENWHDRIYNALKHLDPINKSVKNTPESVEKGCSAVIKHYGLNRGFKLNSVTNKGTVSKKSAKEDDTTKFKKNPLDGPTPL
jgi:hypothetical protein